MFIVCIAAEVTLKTNSAIHSCLCETSQKWKGSMAEQSCVSIQFSSHVSDLLNSYTMKLHWMISSNPSGSPEILPRDSRICRYLSPFRILQHLRVQSCGSCPPYSPVLLETIGNALSGATAATCSLPSPWLPATHVAASSPPSLPPTPSLPWDCCHCLVLQCQCSSSQNAPGKYCPSYIRHFWGRYLVLRLVKQPMIGITCHVNILQNQPSVLRSVMKILDMTQKMWQKTNWKKECAPCVSVALLTHSCTDCQLVLLPFVCCFSF